MSKLFASFGKTEIRHIIAVISVVGCFILLYMLQVRPVPPENKDVLNIAVGFVFGGLLGGINGYFFGSSKNETDAKNSKQ